MAFECQRFPYKTEFSSVVVSCVPAQLETIQNGKKEKIEGFDVVLEDTVFFPEGGGQPDDHGVLGDVPVLQVRRRGNEAVHFTTGKLEVGARVSGKIDWERRWDHMQQHSGQHLISALFENRYNLDTTSWWLGEQHSFIELDTTTVTEEQIRQVENEANENIRKAIPVEVKVYQEGDESLPKELTKKLPEDHGPVRVVSIKGVDDNMCCGTHVSNLSHLQVIKFLHSEKGKKNKINVFFLCGDRVIKHMNRLLQRERQLTAILKNGPDEHVDIVTKLQNSARATQKTVQTLMRELASVQAEKIKAANPKYFVVHRKDGDMDFVNMLLSEMSTHDTVLLVTVGEDNNGQMAFFGPPEVVQELGPKICLMFSGKGAAKGKRFQAKVTQIGSAARQKAEELLQQHFQSTDSAQV